MSPQTIFQIGVYHAKDDVTDLVNNCDVGLLVLVEPLGHLCNKKILECYKDISNKHIYNYAISPDEGGGRKLPFYVHPDGPGVASLNKHHVEKHFEGSSEKIIEGEVSCITMHELFDKFLVTEIDALCIDAEGFDAEIIMSIDLTKYNIKRIIFEYIHIKDENEVMRLRSFLVNHGYKITPLTEYNMEAVKI